MYTELLKLRLLQTREDLLQALSRKNRRNAGKNANKNASKNPSKNASKNAGNSGRTRR